MATTTTYTFTDVTLNRQLRRAHDYCTKHTLQSLVQWHPVPTIGNIPIDDAKDLHLGSRKGKLLRQLCLHVKTPVLKELIRKLAQVDEMRQQSPAAQACFTNWCTLNVGTVSNVVFGTSQPVEVMAKTGLENLPDALRSQLHALVLGWWVRFNIQHKGLGYYLRSGWSNDVDPVTLDDVRTELPCVYTMTTYMFEVVKRKCWVRSRTSTHKGEWKAVYKAVGPKPTKTPRVFVFDVRTLDELFRKNKRKNPFDNRTFDPETCTLVARRIRHLKQRGYLQAPKPRHSQSHSTTLVSEPVVRRTPKERAVSLCSEMDRLNFPTCVEWLTELTRTDIIRWYQRCEDIWTYRAQLSSTQQAQIAPGNRRVFYARNRIRHTESLREVQHMMFDAMERLVTTGHTEADRTNGIMYVLMALTEVSAPIRETYNYLYQPDVVNQGGSGADVFVQAIVAEMGSTHPPTIGAVMETLQTVLDVGNRAVPVFVLQHIDQMNSSIGLPTNIIAWAMQHYADETFGANVAQAVRATLVGNSNSASTGTSTTGTGTNPIVV